MKKQLNLKEFYSSIYDTKINSDFENANNLILQLNNIAINSISIDSLESFLQLSNDIKLLINKIKTYFYLKLYINTKIKTVSKKLAKLEAIEENL